jgi:hypothetical protein
MQLDYAELRGEKDKFDNTFMSRVWMPAFDENYDAKEPDVPVLNLRPGSMEKGEDLHFFDAMDALCLFS